MQKDKNQIASLLHSVRHLIERVVQETGTQTLVPPGGIAGNGKMLRAQLTLLLGTANATEKTTLQHAAAAVEIIHGASLLHDDVIDGAILRRNAPAFWKQHGVNGAILLGDLLVFKGLELLMQIDRNDLVLELIHLSGRVCQSEVEQELLQRGHPGTWATCETIAREKTGSLFAFAACAAAREPNQATALREAGFVLGTAYQLADDLLDNCGDETRSGKTLGLDQQRGKTTAGTAIDGQPPCPAHYIDSLLDRSSEPLSDWPTLQTAWNVYLEKTLRPVLRTILPQT